MAGNHPVLLRQRLLSEHLIIPLFAFTILIFCSASLPAATFTAFGPESFTRGSGSPITESRSFAVADTNAEYTIRISNGGLTDGEFEKVSSSIITLNGVQIVGPEEFNQNVTVVEKPVVLAANNEIGVELRGQPGGGITIEILGTNGQAGNIITITSPAAGSVLNATTVLVQGTFSVSGGAEAGVKVNDIVAEASAGEFAAFVPLQLGSNVITANLIDRGGIIATDSITIEVPAAQDQPLQLLASPSSGVNPLTVELRALNLLERPVVLFELDFEGDGVVDLSLPDFDTINHVYSQEGLFFPTLTATDDLGNKTSTSTVVNVFILPDLVEKWNAMKDALRAADIETALTFIAEESRERYREIFNIVVSELPNIDSVLTDINLLVVEGNQAEFEMLRVSNGVEVSFYVLFVRDNDGIWRLRTF